MSAERMRAEYNAAMNNAKIMAFTQVIHRHPEVSLHEMVNFASEVGLKDLTIGELSSLPKDGKGWTKRLAPTSKKALPPPKNVDTRSAGGRAIHDARILSCLKSARKWISSSDVSDAVGGTTMQARQSLNRLIERDLVEYKGRARGTKYRYLRG